MMTLNQRARRAYYRVLKSRMNELRATSIALHCSKSINTSAIDTEISNIAQLLKKERQQIFRN